MGRKQIGIRMNPNSAETNEEQHTVTSTKNNFLLLEMERVNVFTSAKALIPYFLTIPVVILFTLEFSTRNLSL